MAIDIELLLTRHPLLFFWWKRCVKGFDSSGILTAVGGSGGNIHPLLAVKRTRNKLANEQGGREVAVYNKADVLPFAANEATADLVARIAEIDVHVVAHLACYLKGMLDQHLA